MPGAVVTAAGNEQLLVAATRHSVQTASPLLSLAHGIAHYLLMGILICRLNAAQRHPLPNNQVVALQDANAVTVHTIRAASRQQAKPDIHLNCDQSHQSR